MSQGEGCGHLSSMLLTDLEDKNLPATTEFGKHLKAFCPYRAAIFQNTKWIAEFFSGPSAPAGFCHWIARIRQRQRSPPLLIPVLIGSVIPQTP